MSARHPIDEERLLHKEIAFLDARWARYKHDLRTVTVGRVTAIVNGIASPHYAFRMYLDKRLDRAYARLKELSVGSSHRSERAEGDDR